MNRSHIAMFIAALLAVMILFRWSLTPVSDSAAVYVLTVGQVQLF